MKKVIGKIYIYKVLPPYKNWYSIKTDDGLNRSNVVIVGKKQLEYLQPIITQYFIDNKSEIWLLFLIAHSKR